MKRLQRGFEEGLKIRAIDRHSLSASIVLHTKSGSLIYRERCHFQEMLWLDPLVSMHTVMKIAVDWNSDVPRRVSDGDKVYYNS